LGIVQAAVGGSALDQWLPPPHQHQPAHDTECAPVSMGSTDKASIDARERNAAYASIRASLPFHMIASPTLPTRPDPVPSPYVPTAHNEAEEWMGRREMFVGGTAESQLRPGGPPVPVPEAAGGLFDGVIRPL
jgi:hypothetical protein